jgi:hypothetical protein
MGSVAMTTMATLKSLISASPIRTQPSVSPDPKTVYVNNHSNHSQVGKSQKVSIIKCLFSLNRHKYYNLPVDISVNCWIFRGPSPKGITGNKD